MLERGILHTISISRTSVYNEVIGWCDEIAFLMEQETDAFAGSAGVEMKALVKRVIRYSS